MNTNHRKLQIIIELKERVRVAKFNIANGGKYSWKSAERLVERSKKQVEVFQSRIEKLRATSEVDYLPK